MFSSFCESKIGKIAVKDCLFVKFDLIGVVELENLRIRCDMGRQAYLMNGGRLGRERGTNESIKEFMNKPKSKEIISLLNKGKTVRDIAGRLNVSFNLVIKVRRNIQVMAD